MFAVNAFEVLCPKMFGVPLSPEIESKIFKSTTPNNERDNHQVLIFPVVYIWIFKNSQAWKSFMDFFSYLFEPALLGCSLWMHSFFKTQDNKAFIKQLTFWYPLTIKGMANVWSDGKHMHLSFRDLNNFSGKGFEVYRAQDKLLSNAVNYVFRKPVQTFWLSF